MRWSRYNLTYDLKNGLSLIYNTLSHYVICIDNEEMNRIRLEEIPGDEKEEFYRYGLLADDCEKERMIYELDYRRFLSSSFHMWFYLTFKCNLACPYCYEKDAKGSGSSEAMTLETAERAVRWFEREAGNRKFDELNFTFSGGEPLLNMDIIKQICEEINKAGLRDISKFTLITNGCLLTPEVSRTLLEYRFDTIQITLDGPENIHDSRRFHPDGNPTFKRIIKNLLQLIKISNGEISILIRVNIDAGNAEHIQALFDYFKKYNIDKWVTFNLGDTIKKKDGSDRDILVKIIEIYDRAKAQGLSVCISEATPCSISNGSFYIVAPDGDIYKCPALAGNKDFAISSTNSESYYGAYYRIMNLTPWKKCLDCDIVGICSGGCRYRRFINYGAFDEEKFCRKEYLKEVIKRQTIDHYNNSENMEPGRLHA